MGFAFTCWWFVYAHRFLIQVGLTKIDLFFFLLIFYSTTVFYVKHCQLYRHYISIKTSIWFNMSNKHIGVRCGAVTLNKTVHSLRACSPISDLLVITFLLLTCFKMWRDSLLYAVSQRWWTPLTKLSELLISFRHLISKRLWHRYFHSKYEDIVSPSFTELTNSRLITFIHHGKPNYISWLYVPV